ncbi:FAD-binding and (Fe-S)-binding domain-containing protein [Nocardioides sp. WG-D5]
MSLIEGSRDNVGSSLPGGLLSALDAAVPGGVAARLTDRLAYAHDASHYLKVPQAVVAPRSASEVADLLRAAARDQFHLTFRSGGTSLSGQASTSGVLVDTRRHFRRIDVLDNGARVRVEPGATIRAVNARLAQYGRRLGPDPASEVACTVGGVIANNSSGMACGVHANAYRTLESVILVLAHGTVIDTADVDADQRLRRSAPDIYDGLLELRAQVVGNQASLATIKRLYSIKNTMGYGVNALVDFDRPIDILAHLVVGSEGTLAFVAEATFRTVDAHAHAATGLLVFPTLEAATASLPAVVDSGLATVELLDARSLRVAQRDSGADALLRTVDVDQHAALLVEHQRGSHEELMDLVSATGDLAASLPLVKPAELSTDSARRAGLWRTRKGLYAAVAGARPSGTTALLEDIAVPVDNLLPTCAALVGMFDRYGYEESVIFGHAKDGNIHFLLNERFGEPEMIGRYHDFTEELVTLVLDNEGTLKAEHGTGRVMAPYVRRQYGDELYDVMRGIKTLLDPGNRLNPGVLLDEDPMGHIVDLKISPSVEDEVDRCVECGYCEPVCPSRDLTTTPRQRIVLRREMERARHAGDTDTVRQLQEEYEYDGIETCAVDGMCQTACPVLINTGDLVRRLRTDSAGRIEQAAWRTAARHWDGTTHAASLGMTAAKTAPSLTRTVTEAGRAVLGAQRVPEWSTELPRGGARRQARASGGPSAVYFPSCVTTMFGPAVGQRGVRDALLELCERVGAGMRIPDGIASWCCGTPWKSKGLTEGYEHMRKLVVPALWEASDHGALPVVCDASSCTEGLRLLTDIARSQGQDLTVIDAVAFADEVLIPRLPDLPSGQAMLKRVVVHPTCSSTHLGMNDVLTRVAAQVGEEVVVPSEWGCCGFAGDRGLLHPELTASATRDEAQAVSRLDAEGYISSNRTCELGLTRATGRPYRHVLELLAERYASTAKPTVGDESG